MLSAEGDALYVCMSKEDEDGDENFERITTWEQAHEKFPDNLIVTEYPNLLRLLLSATGPEDYSRSLVAMQSKLQELKKAINDARAEKVRYEQAIRKLEDFSQSFYFYHESTDVYPGHRMITLSLSEFNDATLVNMKVHSEGLEDLIHFIQEFQLQIFSPGRKSFLKGYEYTEKSYLGTGWVIDKLKNKDNPQFEDGKQRAAKDHYRTKTKQ
ncbi:MAG: hypothetical protein ACHQJ6_06905 [Candidatus Berkiellales bacterium]